MSQQLLFNFEDTTEISEISRLIDDIRGFVEQKGINPQETALAVLQTQECVLRLSESEITWKAK